jgi:hypothetical protein
MKCIEFVSVKKKKNDAMLINVFVKEQIDTYVTLYNHVSGPT